MTAEKNSVEHGMTEPLLADRREFALGTKAWKAFQTTLERPAVLKPRLKALLAESDPFVD